MRVIRCITVIGVVLALNLAPVESPSEPAPDPVAAFDSFVSDGGLILPKKLYATAGTEFEVFWCAIVDERDPKIFSYEVHCDCSFVSQRGRGFVIAPGEFAHGRYKLTVTVVVKASDSSTKRKQDFSTTLIVAPANSGSDQRLKMLLVGDSLGHESRFPDQLAMLFKKPRNPQMEFLGSHRWPRMLKVNPYTYVDPLTAEFEDAHEQDDFCIKHTGDPRPEESRVCHEHYGGWTFARFYEFGAVSVYTDCTSARVCHANNSPFVFGYTGNMPNVNVRKYLNETLHLTHDDQMPDYVHIQLGINDATYGRENPDDVEQMHQKQAEIIQNAETLIGHIRAALPNAVITIGSIIQGNAMESAYPESYGPYVEWNWRQIQLSLARLMTDHFESKTGSKIFLVPTHLAVDAVDGYFPHPWIPEGGSDEDYPGRLIGNNIHPSPVGARQLATAIYNFIKADRAGLVTAN